MVRIRECKQVRVREGMHRPYHKSESQKGKKNNKYKGDDSYLQAVEMVVSLVVHWADEKVYYSMKNE